jgi:hypothetical protein
MPFNKGWYQVLLATQGSQNVPATCDFAVYFHIFAGQKFIERVFLFGGYRFCETALKLSSQLCNSALSAFTN